MKAPNKSTPRFGDTARILINAGVPACAILPIAPVNAEISSNGSLEAAGLGKAPARWLPRERAWCGLGGGFIRDGVPAGVAREWERWPTLNAGLLGRYFPAIDSDAESDDAHRLVGRVLFEVFGREAAVAERLRGDSPRRLYAFLCRDPDDPEAWVQNRSFRYRLPTDPEGAFLHGLDIIGYGKQFVATGTHPSGRLYRWHRDYDLCDLHGSGELARVDNEGIVQFCDALITEIEAIGGEVQRSGGGGWGEERDYSGADPIMPIEAVLEGLDRIPNTEANLPARDDLVGVLSAVRAALGREAEPCRADIEEWACADPGWCEPGYFEKVWESLDSGVRVSRNALDILFRRKGVFASARAEFPDDVAEAMRDVRASVEARKGAEAAAIDRFVETYVVSEVNLCRNDGTLQLRRKNKPDSSFKGVDWWRYWDSNPDTKALDAIHALGKYLPTEKGFYTFLRDVKLRHPTCFFSGETLDPRYDRGVVVVEAQPQGEPSHKLNLRFQSPVIQHGRKSPANPKQAADDLEIILEFVRRVFGNDADYELDTLAYMAQTGKRPGHMLFLVGEPGVGKSTYNYILTSMFDGTGQGMGGQIDGTKLTNEGARRFALARVEGCRILSIKELPDGSSPHTMAQITSNLKQMVDAGSDADFMMIERKGKDIETVRNFMRVITTSNYETSIQVEQNDRRIFYVRCGITAANKPGSEYYERLNEAISDPARLATLWRYLCRRDVSGYRAAKAPPVSDAKLEAQVAAMANPWERYAAAALWLFRVSGREMFDVRELGDVMEALADNEYQNSGGAVDDRGEFDFQGAKKPAQAALRYLAAHAEKVGCGKDGRGYKLNGGTKRLPVIYALKGAKAVSQLVGADRDDVLDALDRDRSRNRLREDHPMQGFAGPVPSPEAW